MRSSEANRAPLWPDTNPRPLCLAPAVPTGELFGTQTSTQRSFQRMGKGWLVCYDGKATVLPEHAGFCYMTYLLDRPEQRYSAEELMAAKNHQDKRIYQGSHGVIADREYLRDLHRQLVEVNEALTEAKENSDWANQERLERKKVKLLAIIAAAVGRGNRPRKTGPSENARVSVFMAINRAKILTTELFPDLGRYLQATIFTGSILTFRPMAREEWNIQR